ncbi:MAG: Phenylacetic acid catabolic protein [Halobacteriales archaeon]
MSDWPEGAADYVQAIADTKLLLSQRFAERMLSGPSLEDDIAGASAVQDEIGQVRQLYRLLERQGREREWLHDGRGPEEYANAESLDEPADSWVEFVVQTAVTDRAAWLLLDAIDHEEFGGMVRKMGQDEYFHLEHHDGRLETAAEEAPEALAAAFEKYLPGVLSLVGPAEHDADADPLVAAGFTDRPVAEIGAALVAHYEDLLGDAVGLPDAAAAAPDPEEWNAERRRRDGGGVSRDVLDEIQGVDNREFVVG